ncbi:MAG: nitrogenase component 1 [Eubacteriales bacterium]
MSLTRFLPTPSDRMGILWTLLQIEGAIVLEYGPAGTSAYAKKNFTTSEMSIPGDLFTTQLSESELVLGEDTRLENKIKELDKKLSPKVIFVMASSVSSVVGYDVEGVCSYLKEEVKAQLVVFPQGGFAGDFSSGLQAAYTKLVTELPEETAEKENCYNILGISSFSSHGVGDMKKAEVMMKEHFALSQHAVLSCETNLEKILTMGKAKINLVLSYEGLKGAKILQERFGTPYVYGFPISAESQEKFFGEIATYIPRISQGTPVTATKKTGKIAVFAPYDVLIAMEEYATEVGLEVEFLLCNHSLKEVENPSEKVRYCKTEKEKIALFQSLKDTNIIGEGTFFSLVHESNQTFTLSTRDDNNPIFQLMGHESFCINE